MNRSECEIDGTDMVWWRWWWKDGEVWSEIFLMMFGVGWKERFEGLVQGWFIIFKVDHDWSGIFKVN
jgi:hypothetical protein